MTESESKPSTKTRTEVVEETEEVLAKRWIACGNGKGPLAVLLERTHPDRYMIDDDGKFCMALPSGSTDIIDQTVRDEAFAIYNEDVDRIRST